MKRLKIIDAHIHLDFYNQYEINQILNLEFLEALVSVSTNLNSCKKNLQLSLNNRKVKAAFGFHPEQRPPNEQELESLIKWMKKHKDVMIAIGEVGLPYYLSKEGKVSEKEFQLYAELLEVFVKLAKEWDKPMVIHAVYDDAPIVCDLLEKYSVTKAHFHWFKGDEATIARMIENGYYISVTPEVVYKEKIQRLVQIYPIDQMMVETDGPWKFEGPFVDKKTEPTMIKQSISTIARLKSLSEIEVAEKVLNNTKQYYGF
ncbi:TatD family hydrolase [Oceanobacillus caeni]|uniref:TatD family hydrolase n=2 Tax=Oceanobacillus caeni TaxID=405946 RepID=UPI000DA8E523|nr:TatD family hydrolase [Oceanobacillus caeni]PZD85961.1 TatD family deoxyribonuclease [Bacilli bacterium]MBU8790505.1 TatD family hydrolase [Oceanobacillus caeni]MCR1835284.1 TatD family hydrolase [Oceanobacillus caeni]PZD87390.1 TatD family deoxyribonuclease [Bacilli bacterium]PZD90901.1 TatD family deoxyribonuclease [Bacilli bacterium]